MIRYHKHWLLQPSMYHYRRRLMRTTNRKTFAKVMIEAAQAYYGLRAPRYCQ